MSEQANNRQGPGTESNRERAARGRFTWEPVGDPHSRPSDGAADHDMEAKIHAQAITLAHTTRCTYADARAHVEAMLAPRMGRLDAGQVREALERVVGGDVGPVQYGREMADHDAMVRAFGAPVAPKQPDPAPGQVWLPPPSRPTPTWTDADGTITIADLRGGFVRLVGGASVVPSDLRGWTCIGVATAHGRVMVGDGWRLDASLPEWVVSAVGYPPGSIVLSRPDAGSCSNDAAHIAWTWTRTRYAPARAGEQFRCRQSGSIYKGEGTSIGLVWSAETTERLDPGQGTATDALGRELAFDYGGSIKGPPSVDYPYTLPDLASAPRTLTLAPGSRLTSLGDGRTYRIEPEPEHPSLTLRGTHPQLRALFDAIGRALELPATRHVCAFGEGLTVTVLRDEMLFTPTAQTGLGTAELAGDARGLCALRLTIAQAMANGSATLAHWGAKGPRVEVRREGGPMVAPVAEQASEAPRYTPDPDGAGAWRWTPSNHY